jgi:hypothetical protein
MTRFLEVLFFVVLTNLQQRFPDNGLYSLELNGLAAAQTSQATGR